MKYSKQNHYQLLVTPLIFLIMVAACTNDIADPCQTTFESEVKTILARSCAYSGCHSGADASPWVPATAKDYTTYAGIMETVENGKFAERALELQNMPPALFVPEGKPASLTLDEIETLKCWLQNGFPDR